ncbi:MAG: DNA gyrase subunit A [Acidobacteriota bacterium]|jgi:DNA gyrase subunit A|nr:MAG: DNA gyrase subunit A [Acidobacteriota bacterium]
MDQNLSAKQPVNIEDEMRRSYMDYAMSVIIGRALPDVRDGLKPANRRVLYAMRQMGLASNRPYRKCAKIVGEVIGNYHPHGDASAYDTLVRLAQDFNMRYALVDGQGNFGSIDGDMPAAYRYTEARLRPLAEAMMADLEKDTVDFRPNFDETTEEPSVLPTPFPNLLVNGSTGIAVGMATNIPPHNMREVIDGVLAVIERREQSADDRFRALLQAIPGPDFPSGGTIVGREGIYRAYRTGRGSITVRGRATFEEHPRTERVSIVVTEIPYQVNKKVLVEEIAALVREKKIDGIADLRDESSREGMRIVIELKRGELPDVVLNNLYKQTRLQMNFGITLLAIVGGRPRVLSLLEIIEHFIEFRRDVVRRRTEFDLRKAEARAHVLEGLRIALDHLDAVIALIRGSRNPAEARTGLMSGFGLTQIQAQAILDMQLQRLTGLERQKVLDELEELQRTIARLREILSNDQLLMQIIVDELRQVQQQFGDARRTDIVEDRGDFRIEDLIADEDVVITATDTGYIKRTPLDEYRQQRRGGKGLIGMQTRDEDVVRHLFVANTHAYILIFSDRGRCYWLRVYDIPEVGRNSRGKSIANLVSMAEGESIAALLRVQDFPEGEGERFIVMGTRRGVIKKTDLHAFSNPRAAGIIAIHIDDDDRLIGVVETDGNSDLVLASRNGMAIRFQETDVRPMGRTARGVRGMQLRDGDEVVGIDVMTPGATLLTVCEKGYGKRTDVDEYRVQSRGGIGLKDVLTNDRNGPVVGVACVTDRHEVLLITEQGQVIRTNAADLRPIGRNTLGVKLMDLAPEDRVVSLATLVEPDGDGEGSGGSDDGADATAGSETAAPDAEASDTATADE